MADMFAGPLEIIYMTPSLKRLQDPLQICLQDPYQYVIIASWWLALSKYSL